jgi:1-acyl-sn-glycerol-3-phosphate acyltransferase
MYKFSVLGKENIPNYKKKRFIVAANHISGKDPFLLPMALNIPIAFMAKEELFEKFFSRKLMDFCGAFAVRRDKVEVSTIKTALSIKNTKWMLGLFPQGTRDAGNKIEKITKGFASFAKATKTGILPVAILGSDSKPKFPFSNELTVKVGKLIPYSEDIEDMMKQWCSVISELTGKEYVLV